MWKSLVGILCAIVSLSVHMPSVGAAEPTNSGLLISPPRYSMEVAAGGTTSQEVTIANYTNEALDITLSIDTFTVANLSYEYQITSADKPWLHIEQTSLHLEPNQSQALIFSASPPDNARPGGEYFLIVASATSKNGALTSTIQVAAPVYITVKGDLITTSSLKDTHSISRIAFGTSIPFQIDVENTGNVHYQIDVKGKLDGLFTTNNVSSTQHILLPDTTRRFESSIPSPIFPGFYKATYGYSTPDSGEIFLTAWILYLPPWSIAALILGIWGIIFAVRKQQAKQHLSD